MTTPKILSRARQDIVNMPPYTSARSLVQATDDFVFLDAGECPFPPYEDAPAQNYGRYPDKQPDELLTVLSRLYDVPKDRIIVTRGEDEAIDILVRTFCAPKEDKLMVCPPTFPMYAMSAAIHGAGGQYVPLTEDDFALDVDGVCAAGDDTTKVIFLCSPNNPTSNLLNRVDMLSIITHYKDKAIVVVDEAYIEFTDQASLTNVLDEHENLVVLRSLSKAYAAAGLRCGVAMAHPSIIELLNKVLAPYPVPRPVIDAALKTLAPENLTRLQDKRSELVERRENVVYALASLPMVETVYPSDTNFLLIKVDDHEDFTRYLLERGIIVRDQSAQPGLLDHIRLSIGCAEDMDRLIKALEEKSDGAASERRQLTA